MNILITSGAGYIVSHASVVLSEAGHQVVILDNFCNSHRKVLDSIAKILGKAIPYVDLDIRDTNLVQKTLQAYQIDGVIHLAGLKAVGESVQKSIQYKKA